jgi:hypothetical protein
MDGPKSRTKLSAYASGVTRFFNNDEQLVTDSAQKAGRWFMGLLYIMSYGVRFECDNN